MSPYPTLGRCLALAALTAALAACGDDRPPPLRAFRATRATDLVGGPVAYADVGDFVLQNDKVKVAILQGGKAGSWGPGLFGGSLVDADIVRSDARYPPGSGRDKFAELFPFANLVVPAPQASDVKVVADGSDGKTATVRVEGKGVFLFEALSVLRQPVLAVPYPDVNTFVHFRTDYSLHPGESFVTMTTWVIADPRPTLDNQTAPGKACADDGDCPKGSLLRCKGASSGTKGACKCASLADQGCGAQSCALSPTIDGYGCPTCGCSPTLQMANTTGDQSVFGAILGDSALSDKPVARPGVGGGDFVFFGNQADIFVPGHGFDEEKPVWDALFDGRDTFGKPLAFDFVSAAGGEVSYAYYTKRQPGAAKDPQVLVPVFTSAATAFVTATLNCKVDTADDDTCDKAKVWEFTRYLAIGAGDVASVSDIVWAHRGTSTGTVKGYVRWSQTGQPAANATVLVLRDPAPGTAWPTLDALVAANRAVDASPGVINAIDADPGVDLQEDGAFEATMPPGDYQLVAMDAFKVVASAPQALKVVAGRTHVVVPALPSPARLRVTATDSQGGGRVPAKITVVRLGADGKPLFRDGGRRPYLGQGRLGIGVEHIGFAMDGRFDVAVAAGRYQVAVSHGTEWSIHKDSVDVAAGQSVVLNAGLRRDIDTKGWVGGDFHLHAEPSFDSGMPIGRRVETVAAEGVDYVASTDHDVLSDYAPFIRKYNLLPWLRAVVGSEISTLEIGHYIGFPLHYKQLDVPSHGSVEWYCKSSGQVMDDLLARAGLDGGASVTRIIAHPRDGFLGWLDQAGVNAYSHTRKLSLLEANNPTLRTVGCDHDAMEVFNGKRFDMTHTATVWEVQVFSRCIARIDRAGVGGAPASPAGLRAALKTACPELKDKGFENVVARDGIDSCPADEDTATCKMRYRMALAEIMAGEINRRTKEEQDAWIDEPTGDVAGEKDPQVAADKKLDALKALCDFDPDRLDEPFDVAVPPSTWLRPCGRRDGVLSDYFRLLERGLVRGIVGGSDSHGYKQEPGLPRTMLRVEDDDPLRLDIGAAAKAIRQGNAVASYGPMIDVTVAGKGPGETVSLQPGAPLAVKVRVQTASWFGVDRVEVYLNGRVAATRDLKADPARIVDLDETFALVVPDRDSHIVVVAVGTDPKHLMRPVYLDVPFGELQLARVASYAFSALFAAEPLLKPVAKAYVPPPARIPDFFPVLPMAVSAALLIDTKGDGRYDAPLPRPSFCSPRCDKGTGAIVEPGFEAQGKPRTCKDLQSDYACLEPELRCGLPVPGVCSVFEEQKKTALRAVGGAHGAP